VTLTATLIILSPLLSLVAALEIWRRVEQERARAQEVQRRRPATGRVETLPGWAKDWHDRLWKEQ
jgi:hypothetical protein